MQAYYHSREPFGTVDGQGIRYVLFLAGCKLGCKFCHNPDTWQQHSQTITVDAVLADIAKYRQFYDRSGGGLTVSGGEPLLQPEFVAALLRAARAQGIHTTIDTAGYYPAANLTAVLPYTDAVLFCLKAADSKMHQLLTGLEHNEGILANLRLAAAHVPVTVRYVIIPGLTDRADQLTKLAQLICSLPAQVPVELLPYHTYGRDKWQKLGWQYQLDGIRAASKEDVAGAASLLWQLGITVLSCE